MTALEKIGLGGSCHWCTDAIFQSLRGVLHVSQGWIASDDTPTRFSDEIQIQICRLYIF
ncbi:peptide-methionine (S)-S-oxide reductase [Dyadobacter beijingensis]|uniref:peptide-methionine (S)-S-oxide reductase n=1 Tax=Dyadobacter beijingensis TaxID=365489 RepID=UPI001B7F9E6B